MTPFAHPGALWSTIPGLFSIALGLFVLIVRPDRRVNVAFALYNVFLGAIFIALNAYPTDEPAWRQVFNAVEPVFVMAGLALLAVVLWFPRPFDRSETPLLLVAIALFLAFELLWFWALGPHLFFNGDYLDAPARFLDPRGPGIAVAFWLGIAYFFMPLRYGALAARLPPEQRRSLTLLSGALAMYGGAGGAFAAHPSWTGPIIVDVPSLEILFVFVMASIWSVQAYRIRGEARRGAATVAGVWIVSFLLGYLVTYAVFLSGVAFLQKLNVLRGVFVLVVAYAILRHQLLGIDVKVKWMIDRGTLAAVFIAVFFVVTVVAENYLTDRYGWAFGGIGAGLLLFALAPLQRLADRVADAAIPGVKPVGEMTDDERLALYAAQLRAAYHDGHVDAGERRMLENLRQNLSIDAETAMRTEAECTGGET